MIYIYIYIYTTLYRANRPNLLVPQAFVRRKDPGDQPTLMWGHLHQSISRLNSNRKEGKRLKKVIQK